jgi:2-polyprenyl-3-methyl-5-hydroxy-6-metoxy-1,4-benzoquinol methylase
MKETIKRMAKKLLGVDGKRDVRPTYSFSSDVRRYREWDKFLLANKIERMDANRYDIFDKTRCDFHLDRYRLACEYTEGKDVLDCASGTGYGAHALSLLGRAKSVRGVEYSEDAVKYAQAMYATDIVSFQQGTILDLPFEDNAIDVFTSFETIEHIENEAGQLDEIHRVLKPGGLYIMSTPNDWESDKVHPHHVRQYDYNSLKGALSGKFSIQRIYNQNSGTPGRAENNDCPRSISLSTESNHHLAECFIAVATKAG